MERGWKWEQGYDLTLLSVKEHDPKRSQCSKEFSGKWEQVSVKVGHENFALDFFLFHERLYVNVHFGQRKQIFYRL